VFSGFQRGRLAAWSAVRFPAKGGKA
jgi:hypothetical protein